MNCNEKMVRSDKVFQEEERSKKMKHLNESARIKIEHYLNMHYSLRTIAKMLSVSPSTISREISRNKKEIKANTYGIYVNCKHRKHCDLLMMSTAKQCSVSCPKYETESCSLFDKKNSSPVCNSCPKVSKCRLAKKAYKAQVAEFKYENRIETSRSSSRITVEQFTFLNNLFTSLMKQGQSVSVIYNNHKDEIMVSENTIRNYLNKGLFHADLLDAIHPRFVAKTSKKRRIIKNVELLTNRTYDDYLDYIRTNDSLVVQVDTVVGKLIDKKKILTIHWPTFHFQIGILLDSLNPLNVNRCFTELRNRLGDSLYRKLFQVLVTDNGIEFSLLDEIEIDSNGELISRVFFCDPYSSSQKGACERNHEFIRYILPKGRSFEFLTQKDVDLIFSHINSTPRKSLGFSTPYAVFANTFGKDLLNQLNIHLVPKDEVLLKPTLITKR